MSFHGIMERFGLEGTLKDPCHGQGQLPPDQADQSPVQPGFEHFQGVFMTSVDNSLQSSNSLHCVLKEARTALASLFIRTKNEFSAFLGPI